MRKYIAIIAILLLFGYVLSGCAAFDFLYWCARSAPGKGGPFCP